jgi:hypothetical protein
VALAVIGLVLIAVDPRLAVATVLIWLGIGIQLQASSAGISGSRFAVVIYALPPIVVIACAGLRRHRDQIAAP